MHFLKLIIIFKNIRGGSFIEENILAGNGFASLESTVEHFYISEVLINNHTFQLTSQTWVYVT